MNPCFSCFSFFSEPPPPRRCRRPRLPAPTTWSSPISPGPGMKPFPSETGSSGPWSGKTALFSGCRWTGPTSGISGPCRISDRRNGRLPGLSSNGRQTAMTSSRKNSTLRTRKTPPRPRSRPGRSSSTWPDSARRNRSGWISFGHPDVATWADGRTLETFIQADAPIGFFRFSDVPAGFKPVLRMPPYAGDPAAGPADSVSGQDLRRLGYLHGRVEEGNGSAVYRQKGWNGFYYEIAVVWRMDPDGGMTGAWSVTSKSSDDRGRASRPRPGPKGPGGRARSRPADATRGLVEETSGRDPRSGFPTPSSKNNGTSTHINSERPPGGARRPSRFRPSGRPTTAGCLHGKAIFITTSTPSSVTGRVIPETGSKKGLDSWTGFGTNARIQALYPGLFRDVGTQRPRRFHPRGRTDGRMDSIFLLPHVGAWLAQHFDLHWRFSRDREFLRDRAYPWVRDVAVHLEELSVRRPDGTTKAAA